MPLSNFECRNSGIEIHLTMKNSLNTIGCRRFLPVLYCLIILSICGLSCSKNDDPVIVPPDNSITAGYEVFLFYNDNSKDYGDVTYTQCIGANWGPEIFRGSGFNKWKHLAGVEVGSHQYMFGHNYDWTGSFDNKSYMINQILGNGEIGIETEHGTFIKNYETLAGFRLGTRGFLFGQDRYGDHYWFVQEINSGGRLGAETDNGSWNNYYKTATPFYVNGKTFIFFQTEDSDNYWFIAYVSPAGQLYDVCDGYWGNYWPATTSYQLNGKTYLFGLVPKDGNNDQVNGDWFIQAINSDGSMGAETDRGLWVKYYNHVIGYNFGGRAYIFGYKTDYSGGAGAWFIQEVTSEGKMGAEISHGSMNGGYDKFIPFKLYNAPGSSRFSIGWDLSPTTGAPTRPWSEPFSDSWGGEFKFGGGAALAQINRDAGSRLDAVLTGISSQPNGDCFYYKIAWDIDNAGKPAAMSNTIFGPNCGESQAGGGTDIADIDRNGVPDLVLMSVDDPEGANSFWYFIGWNLTATGQPASWSGKFQLDGLGFDNAGGGLALGDLDGNGQPEMVVMAIDKPSGAKQFWYRIGRNLDQSGKAASWTGNIPAPFYVGFQSAGGGAALADINHNGKPDLVLMDIDSPQGPNPFWCYVGWDIDINGNAVSWEKFIGPSLGNMTSGGGAAIGDIDKNGIMDLLLMTIDNPIGKD